MKTITETHCHSCHALVNSHWGRCAVCHKPLVDWLAAWRELAVVTNGIEKEDPRFPHIMTALDQCDVAYLSNDWTTFQRLAWDVHKIVDQEPT